MHLHVYTLSIHSSSRSCLSALCLCNKCYRIIACAHCTLTQILKMNRSDILQNINWRYASLGPGDTFVVLPNLDKVLAFWAVVPSWVIVPLHMLGQSLLEAESALASSFSTPNKVSFRLNFSHVNCQCKRPHCLLTLLKSWEVKEWGPGMPITQSSYGNKDSEKGHATVV